MRLTNMHIQVKSDSCVVECVDKSSHGLTARPWVKGEACCGGASSGDLWFTVGGRV